VVDEIRIVRRFARTLLVRLLGNPSQSLCKRTSAAAFAVMQLFISTCLLVTLVSYGMIISVTNQQKCFCSRFKRYHPKLDHNSLHARCRFRITPLTNCSTCDRIPHPSRRISYLHYRMSVLIRLKVSLIPPCSDCPSLCTHSDHTLRALAAIPWRILTDLGHKVTFATPDGRPSAGCDPLVLKTLLQGQPAFGMHFF